MRGWDGVWIPFWKGRGRTGAQNTCYAFQKVETESQLQLAGGYADEAKGHADGAKDTVSVLKVDIFINRTEISGEIPWPALYWPGQTDVRPRKSTLGGNPTKIK